MKLNNCQKFKKSMDNKTNINQIAKIFCQLFSVSLKKPSDDCQEDIDKFIAKRMRNTLEYMNTEGFIKGYSIDKEYKNNL